MQIFKIAISLVVWVFFWGLTPAHAAEPVPGDACSVAGAFSVSAGPEGSGVTHFLVCQGGTWKAIVSANASGEVTKIGNLSCAANEIMKFDGTKWACASTLSACDSAPAAFDFADQTGVAQSTVIESDILPIAGTDPGCNSTVSISGSGTPSYRICSASDCSSVTQAWTTSTLAFDIQGKYIQVRTTSPAADAQTHAVTVTIGGVSNIWSVSTPTASCGNIGLANVGTVCADDTIYAGISPDGNKHMFITRCDFGMTWNGTHCSGLPTLRSWNNGNTTGFTATTYTNANTGKSNSANIYALDADSGVAGTQPHQAVVACEDLTVHGHSDWYLPAANELFLIYQNLFDGVPLDSAPHPLVSGFAYNQRYWASTEAGQSGRAWSLFFGTGTWPTGEKYIAYAVRCVRTE